MVKFNICAVGIGRLSKMPCLPSTQTLSSTDRRENMADIKVGDTVTFTGKWDDTTLGTKAYDEGIAQKTGKVGKVTAKDFSIRPYRVQLPDGKIYWYTKEEVKKVEEPKMFNIGDKVLVPAIVEATDTADSTYPYQVRFPATGAVLWVKGGVNPYVESESEKKQRVRAEALAKLTEEEKEVLGLTLAAFRF
jgi:hypothetical protein